MAELLINGTDAQSTYGICMGKGFRDALLAPAPAKDYIENKSRLEHGKTVLTNNARLDSRELTLTFYMQAGTPTQLQQRKTAFYNALYRGDVTIKVPAYGSETYRLVYKKASSYAQSVNGTFCKIAVKFEEPNPKNR